MKKLIQQIWKLAAIVLPLVFLSSCYEIVYVNQQADMHSMGMIRPDVCIQVYNTTDQPVIPYLGFLAHNSWEVINGFVYTKGSSVVIGQFKYNPGLSGEMDKLDPAPHG